MGRKARSHLRRAGTQTAVADSWRAKAACPNEVRTHGEYQSRTSGVRRSKDDVEAVQGSVRGWREVSGERRRLPSPATQRAGRNLSGTPKPSLLRELYWIDHRLVRGDTDP